MNIEVMKQALDALNEVNDLIKYQYTGSKEAMSALQNACDGAWDATKSVRKAIEETQGITEKKMNKEEMFRKIVELHDKREAYFNSIPADLRSIVFDNEYANSLYKENEILMEQMFGEHYEDVMWYLYEWKTNYWMGGIVSVNGVETKINNLDEYIDWLKRTSGF